MVERPACGNPAARAELGAFRAHTVEDDWATLTAPEDLIEASWGLAVLDAEGDGPLEIFVPSFGQDRLFTRLGDGQLIEITEERLPTGDTPSLGASAADVDGDGDTDLLVLRRGPDALLLNDGAGRFSDATPEALRALDTESYHAAWGDLTGDGLPELYVGTFYGMEDDLTPHPNTLLENQGDGDFCDLSEVLDAQGARLTPANAGGMTDLDDDGDLDLYVVNDKPDQGFVSMFLENDGAGGLRWDAGANGLAVSTRGMGLGLGDLNGDGLPEVLVTGWDELVLMMSAADGTWYDASASWRLLPDDHRVVAWGVELADLDNDGDDDVVIAYGSDFDWDRSRPQPLINPERQPLGVYLNEGDHFEEVSAAWQLAALGNHRGFALVDLNEDGLLDLVVQDLLGPPRLNLSRCSDARYLDVELRGPAPNTQGLGARVIVEAGGQRWWRELRASTTNIASASPPVAHFGLGELDEVERLEITWPDGGRSVFTDLPTRAKITVTHEAALEALP